jgi:hypothetical protein
LQLTKTKSCKEAKVALASVDDLADMRNFDPFCDERFAVLEVGQTALSEKPWHLVSGNTDAMLKKVDASGVPIGEILEVGQGMQTGRNGVFGKLDAQTIKGWRIDPALVTKRARNSNITRYSIRDAGEYLLYLEDVSDFDRLPKAVQQHLTKYAKELKGRAAYKRGDCQWWQYTWPLHKELHKRAKLYCPYLAKQNRFALDRKQEYLGLTDTTVLFDSGQPEHLEYLLGLLNSRLLTYRFHHIGKLKSGNIYEYFWNSVSRLPIRTIDFDDSADKARHDRMVELVQRMLDLHKQLGEAKSEHGRVMLERQITATDREIDALVYELYGLTDEEIAIVEAATA